MPTMLDLFSGAGGASAAMVDRGWRVVTVDNNPAHHPEICAAVEEMALADAAALSWIGTVALLWASPPCTEFSRESMPWCKTGREPDLSLVRATLRIVEEVGPRWWCIENVRGSLKWLRPLLGKPLVSTGPIFLWGRLPPMIVPKVDPYKERITGERPDLRSKLPYHLSMAVALACEAALSPPTTPAASALSEGEER